MGSISSQEECLDVLVEIYDGVPTLLSWHTGNFEALA